jgi:hypothetical protein
MKLADSLRAGHARLLTARSSAGAIDFRMKTFGAIRNFNSELGIDSA